MWWAECVLWSFFLLVPDEDMSLRAFRWLRRRLVGEFKVEYSTAVPRAGGLA